MVFATKAAVVEPTATVTELGTVTAELLLDIATGVAAVAAAVRRTAQLLLDPDATVEGLHVTLESTGALPVGATENAPAVAVKDRTPVASTGMPSMR